MFPSHNGKPLSDMALTMLTRSKELSDKYGYHTCHGMRSTFKDWAEETTTHAPKTIEHALAHELKSKTEAAYQRRRHHISNW
jgi:hypothetical protein